MTRSKVITYTGHLLESGEPYVEEVFTDVIRFPLSFVTADWILKVLRQSPYFSPEVNQWAKNWSGNLLHPLQRRDALRQWWKENEGSFRKGDYASVKPGVAPPSIPAPISHPDSSPAPAAKGTAASPIENSSVVAQELPTAPKSEAAASKEKTPILFHSVIALAALAIVTALFLARRGKYDSRR